VTTECHTKTVAGRVLHGPTAQRQCDACHVVTDVQKHTYRLVVGKADLCGYCHTQSERTVVHKPVADRECDKCHDPHGSDRRLQLLGDPSGPLCFPCHKPEEYGGVRFTTAGMEVTGNCGVCHESHSSWMPRLLPKEVQQLCLFCHENLRARMELLGRSHKPVMDGRCLDCHDAHSTGHPGQLRDAPPQLCYLCHDHEDIRKLIETSSVVHGALKTKESCNGCHAGHGSVLPKLLAEPEKTSCLSCHDEPLKTEDDRVIPDLAQVLKENPRHHGPVREGQCTPCHDAHASAYFALLPRAYPESFYAAFEVSSYALCFECHVENLVTSEQGIGASEFRNKEKNLHFVHVNKPFRGRTCRACHEVHASSRPFHIREAAPFGRLGWGIEVNHTRRPNGGSCAPGCHEARFYDRGEGEMPKAPRAGLKPEWLERFLKGGP
jgi:predicted CXXCH cytochrome family protein